MSAGGYSAQQHQTHLHGMFSSVDVQPPNQRAAGLPTTPVRTPQQPPRSAAPTIDQLVSASRSSPFKQFATSPPVPKTTTTAPTGASAMTSSSGGMFSFLANPPPPSDAARHLSPELITGLQQQLAHQIVENEKQAATLEQSLTLLMQERAQRAALSEEVQQARMATLSRPTTLWTPESMLASLATTRMFIAELEGSGRRQMQRAAVVELEGANRRSLERRWSQAWADLATWSRAYIGSIAAELYVNAAADARIRATPAVIEAAVQGRPIAIDAAGTDEAMFAAFLLEELLAAQETHETTRRYWLIERERREWLTNVAGPHKDAVTRATTAVLVNAMRSQEVLVANLRAEAADRQAGFSPNGRNGAAAEGFERSPHPSAREKPPLAPVRPPPLVADEAPTDVAADDDRPVAAHSIAVLAGDTLRSHPPRTEEEAADDGSYRAYTEGGHAHLQVAAHEADNDDDILDENQLIAKLERSGQRHGGGSDEQQHQHQQPQPSSRLIREEDEPFRESPEPRPRTPPAEVRRQDRSASAEQPTSQSPPAAATAGSSPRRMTRRELLALTAELIDQNSVLADALADIQANPSATVDAATQRTPLSRQFQSPREVGPPRRSPTESPARARATARSREESPAAAEDEYHRGTLVAVPESASTVPMPAPTPPVREAAITEEEPRAAPTVAPASAFARSPVTKELMARETTPPRTVHQDSYRDALVAPSDASEQGRPLSFGVTDDDGALDDGELTPPPRSPLFPPQVPPTLSLSSERLPSSSPPAVAVAVQVADVPRPRSPPNTPREEREDHRPSDAARPPKGDETHAAASHQDTSISSIGTATSPSHSPFRQGGDRAPEPPVADADVGDVCLDEGRPSAGSNELGGASSWVVVSTVRSPPREQIGPDADGCGSAAMDDEEVTCADDTGGGDDDVGGGGFRGFTPPPRADVPRRGGDDAAQHHQPSSSPTHFLSDPMHDDLTDDDTDATPYR
jgi:hypothetical protein